MDKSNMSKKVVTDVLIGGKLKSPLIGDQVEKDDDAPLVRSRRTIRVRGIFKVGGKMEPRPLGDEDEVND